MVRDEQHMHILFTACGRRIAGVTLSPNRPAAAKYDRNEREPVLICHGPLTGGVNQTTICVALV